MRVVAGMILTRGILGDSIGPNRSPYLLDKREGLTTILYLQTQGLLRDIPFLLEIVHRS
jgi:hypothetical protein